jgi:competence protein ComEC
LLYVALCSAALLQAHVFYSILQTQDCRNPKAILAFLDIGQGDSIYIQDTTGKSILIDTGPKDNGLVSRIQEVTGCLDVYIDTLVLTHPDADHIGEAKRLIDKNLVGKVIHNGFLDLNQPDETLMENELETVSVTKESVLAGDNINLEDISIKVLYPIETPYLEDIATSTETKQKKKKKKTQIDDNLYSIVASLVYTGKNSKSFLLTGDAPISVEDKLIKQYGSDLDIDILKLGHHGSKTSSGQDFLSLVSPDDVVISASKNNRYNHPSSETMERIYNQRRKKPLRIRETSVEGNIVYLLE